MASLQICGVIGLQRLWRGFTARRYHQLLVRVHRTASNAIGGWYLGSLARTVARNNLRRAVHCATKIQACIRCFLAQQYVKRLRVEYRIAATKLQVGAGMLLCSVWSQCPTYPDSCADRAGGEEKLTASWFARCWCDSKRTGSG